MIDGRPTIMIATPAYGGAMFMEYVTSLINNVLYLERKNIRTRWQFMNKEALITRARNELVRYFLEETHDDYLMFIDADISFPDDGIYRLLQHKQDIACGVYPKKLVFWDRVREAALRGEKDIEKFGCSYVLNVVHGSNNDEIVLDENGLVETMHGGTGFMLIHRDVFKVMRNKVPTYRTSLVCDKEGRHLSPLTKEFFGTSITEDGMLLSEDYHFCALWTKEGGKIFADPTIELKHVGQHVFAGDLMRAGRNNT